MSETRPRALVPLAVTAAAALVVLIVFVDTLATVVLFVLVTPLIVAGAAFMGGMSAMLGDGYPKSKVSTTAIVVAIVGPMVGSVAILLVSVVLATSWGGRTFYLPLLAVAASAVWALLLFSAAGALVQKFA